MDQSSVNHDRLIDVANNNNKPLVKHTKMWKSSDEVAKKDVTRLQNKFEKQKSLQEILVKKKSEDPAVSFIKILIKHVNLHLD